MKRFRALLSLLLLSLLPMAPPALADVVVLKNGRELTGKVVKEKRDEIVFRSGGMDATIPRDDIREIRKGEIPAPPVPVAPTAPKDPPKAAPTDPAKPPESPKPTEPEKPPPTPAAPAGDPAVEIPAEGRIAFVGRGSMHFVWTMHPDGTNAKRLAGGMEPAWSPDGKRIAYAPSYLDGGDDITVMDADGKNPVRLTTAEGQDRAPAWSPDGKKIAFWSERDKEKDGGFKIYVMDADGKNQTRLTRNEGSDMNPTWSPDGARIAFESHRDGQTDIYVMDADGKNVRRVTDGKETRLFPAWSPDGEWIAFVTWRKEGWPVCLIHPDGSGYKELPTPDLSARRPAWSPDGKRIVFAGAKPDNTAAERLHVIDADGSNLKRITESDDHMEWCPAWGRKP